MNWIEFLECIQKRSINLNRVIIDLKDGYEFQKSILDQHNDLEQDRPTECKSVQTIEITSTDSSQDTWNVYVQTENFEFTYITQIRLLREKYNLIKLKYKNLKSEYRKLSPKLKYETELKEKYKRLYDDCHELIQSITKK